MEGRGGEGRERDGSSKSLHSKASLNRTIIKNLEHSAEVSYLAGVCVCVH